MSSLICEKIGSFFWIRFNRPHKKNAIDAKTYELLSEKLHNADMDNDIVFTVFTGVGDFFSSGSDFSLNSTLDKNSFNISQFDGPTNYINALIEHSKILIALVNGPAIGLSCTTLSLFDYVVASDKAFFLCPFTEIGVVPEGTSSVNFPASLGYLRAAKLLLFGAKLDAAEAHRIGFVSCVILASSPKEFYDKAIKILDDYQRRLAPHSLLASKAMLKTPCLKQHLQEVNLYEFSRLKTIWNSDATQKILFKRFVKSKL